MIPVLVTVNGETSTPFPSVMPTATLVLIVLSDDTSASPASQYTAHSEPAERNRTNSKLIGT